MSSDDYAETLPVCAVDGCPGQPDPVLCRAHARRLGDMLTEVGALYGRLDAAPSMAAREPGTGGGGTLPSQRSVGDLAVMSLRDRRTAADPDDPLRSVLAVLHEWAEQVRAPVIEGGRGLSHPMRLVVAHIAGKVGPVCEHWCRHWSCVDATWRYRAAFRPTVASERKLLAAQLDPWILGQDWCGVFYGEIRDLWRLLDHAVAGPPIPRPRRTCPECGGMVTVAAGVAECDGCGGYWSGLDLARLGAAA